MSDDISNIPRMSVSERNKLNPIDGMVDFDYDSGQYVIYINGKWNKIAYDFSFTRDVRDALDYEIEQRNRG